MKEKELASLLLSTIECIDVKNCEENLRPKLLPP